MSLGIIGAGMGRTGTHSLKLALEMLGFGPCHHMFELRDQPGQLAEWQAIARGVSPDWNNVFAQYKSQVDWPGARYWKEIASAFPEAKVILTHRARDDWYSSFADTIVRANRIGRTEDPNPHTRAMAELLDQIVFNELFDSRVDDKDHVLNIYGAHLAEVRKTIPADRLLNFDVREGWEPLCRFLGLPVPDAAFPRTNSKQDFLIRKSFLKEPKSAPGT